MQNRINWQAVDFDWNRAKAFLVTVEQGSLSAASKSLALAQPTLSRQVAALEQELGVKLFERRGRGLAITPSGLALVAHVRAMAEAAGQLSLAATGRAEAVEGLVRVSASEVMATYVLPKLVGTLRSSHPALEIAIVSDNAVSDLKGREADIALRLIEPTEPDLIVKRVGTLVAHFYGTPRYLRGIGQPTELADLSAAQFVGGEANRGFVALMGGLGLALSEKNFAFKSESRLVQWELVKQGLGITVMPDLVGDAEPLVTRLPISVDALQGPMWLVSHAELRTSGRVRVAFDHLAAELAALLG